MAKTIKFNLIMDGNPVRNLDGIREHFSIEDILKYYKNGLLVRWLEVRSYDKELEKVKAIDDNLDDLSLINELIKIFEVETDEKKIVTAIGILNYLNEENDLNMVYSENKFKKNQVIDDYHSGYDSLIDHIIENSDNMSMIKADVIELENNYIGLFRLDHYSLFFRLFEAAPKAVFAILTRLPSGNVATASLMNTAKNLAIPSSVKPWISIVHGWKRSIWNAFFCLLSSRLWTQRSRTAKGESETLSSKWAFRSQCLPSFSLTIWVIPKKIWSR